MYESLHLALHSLPPTGAAGFEGLVQALVSTLSGYSFLRAKAGSQEGKDLSTASLGPNCVDIECKRYQRGDSPSKRELLGELQEAIAASGGMLDIWLVASTGSIGSAEAAVISKAGDTFGVKVEVIDWQEAGLPQIAVLCAAAEPQTLKELAARGSTVDPVEVAKDLEGIRSHEAFLLQAQNLKLRLTAPDLGLDHARSAANAWIAKRLASRANARADFGQPLCVSDGAYAPYLRRSKPHADLQGWLQRWAQTSELAIVVGDEGVGKSWSTMGWWSELEPKPLTLLVTSNRASTTDALDLMAECLQRQTGVRDHPFWRRRVDRWLRRPVDGQPVILLILDGLNERPQNAWGELFAGLARQEFAGRVATLATCRPSFWSKRVEGFVERARLIGMADFDKAELYQAWAGRTPALDEVPAAVQAFICKPRILRLAQRHMDNLIKSGDLTVERLLFEDWEDRRRSRTNLVHSPAEFNNVVIGLARDVKKGILEFPAATIRAYSSVALGNPNSDFQREFDEITAGALFEWVDPVSDLFRLRREYAPMALGMLLAREARSASRSADENRWSRFEDEALNPILDLDQAGSILSAACTVACLEPEYPNDARVRLFRIWLGLRNLAAEQWDSFVAHVPVQPATYFDLAEALWEEGWISNREWVADAILRWRRLPAVGRLINERCSRWLGIWHADWHPFLDAPKPERIAGQREVVARNLEGLASTEKEFADRVLTEASNPRQCYLSRLALLLISFGPRNPQIRGLLAWAMSRALMQLPAEWEEVAWCLRLNELDPIETEDSILAEVARLLEGGSSVSASAARYLLTACGTVGSQAVLGGIPSEPPVSDPDSPEPIPAADPLDPAVGAADGSELVARLQEFDLEEFRRSLGRTSSEYRFELMEPAFCRFAPQELATFYRRLLASASAREGISLRQLGLLIPEVLALISFGEAAALSSVRRALFPLIEERKESAEIAEGYLFLGELGLLGAEEQLRALLERPDGAWDMPDFESAFGQLSSEFASRALLDAERGSVRSLRRLLWFLGTRPVELTAEGLSALCAYFVHEDVIVRMQAFRMGVGCASPAVGEAHLRGDWVARSNEYEAHWGSRLLIESSDRPSYRALRERVSTRMLGYLAERDGSDDAFDAFAVDLDLNWETATADRFLADDLDATLVFSPPSSSPDAEPSLRGIVPALESALRTVQVFDKRPTLEEMKAFFAEDAVDRVAEGRKEFALRVRELLRKARDAGRSFLGDAVQSAGLGRVVARRPDLVDRWLDGLRQGRPGLGEVGEFYRALSLAMGRDDPSRAVWILREVSRLRTFPVVYRGLNVDSLTWSAFQLPTCPDVDDLREQLLSQVTNDDGLFGIALAAQANGAGPWLQGVIARDIEDRRFARCARAMTLLGCLDEPWITAELRGSLELRDGALGLVAARARDWIERNRRARLWYVEFLVRPDEVEAWAAWRLFLRCVDRRYYIWRREVQNRGVSEQRRRQIEATGDVVSHAIDRTEAGEGIALKETFFGRRISKGEIFPWYRDPPLAPLDEDAIEVELLAEKA